ncbi:MAG: molecular chaperone [Luteibacter sp.]
MARFVVGLALAVACVDAGHAGVVIGGTRVVFPSGSRDVSLRVENKGEAPALVQVWVDDGDERSTPDTARAPFAITPPVFRIDAGRGHSLRIVYTGDTPPVDRETLFWLNVLEIPPKPEAGDGANVLQFAFRHRVKLMHRPVGLAVSPDKAALQLTWSVSKNDDSQQLRVTNASPYVVSFNDVSLAGGDPRGAPVSLGGGMALPGGLATFALPRHPAPGAWHDIRFATINDYGAVVRQSVAFPAPAPPVVDD